MINKKTTYPSEAHEKSAFAIIDPLYSSDQIIPTTDLTINKKAPWIYGEAELECWRLSVLQNKMQDAKLKVSYPGKFHSPANNVSFRHEIKPESSNDNMISMHAVGEVMASIEGAEIYRSSPSNDSHRIKIPEDKSIKQRHLVVNLTSIQQGEPLGILIEKGPFSTNKTSWQWSDNRLNWSTPTPFPQTDSGAPPHRPNEVTTILDPEKEINNVIDFGKELFGHITFTCSNTPELYAGESIPEAINQNKKDMEQSTELIKTKDGHWISKHLLAFRYVRILGDDLKDVKCHALFHPAQYHGAFACSNKKITQIWMNSAYTLRLCMHDFLIDGIKRDRLPWTGDLAMSMLANAFSFADSEIVRRSITALGRSGISEIDINGIVDYSLWWVIAQDLYQLYFTDHNHLVHDYPRIKDSLENLIERCDNDGLLRPAKEVWLFIDWVDTEKFTSLQILLWWALKSGASLADRMQDKPLAKQWRTKADLTKDSLQSKAWDEGQKAWKGGIDQASKISRHANLLAIISGLTQTENSSGILKSLLGNEASPVGTPYMKGFEGMALAKLSRGENVLSDILSYWGGMLDRGATTFWEAYDPEQTDDNAYSFYGRPFAKSLCHAWSAGPTALIPYTVMGVRPLADGWKRFTVEPNLSGLTWAYATIPTPYGNIEIKIDSNEINISVPANTTLEFKNKSYAGPIRILKKWSD